MRHFVFISVLVLCILNAFSLCVFADTSCYEREAISSGEEKLPDGIDMSFVIEEATERLKGSGYKNIPDVMDAQLDSGILSDEDYDAYYPTAGAGYIDWVCYVEEATNKELIESIIGQIKVSTGYNAFYIEGFKGYSDGNSIIIRIYRASI